MTTPATIGVKFTSSDKGAGEVAISLDSTVGALKDAIRSKFEMEPKRIIFQGRILNKDDQTLEQCKLKDGLTVVVQAAQPGGPSPATPSATAPLTPSTATQSPATAAAAGGDMAAAAQAMQGLGLGGGVGPMSQAVATVRAQPAGQARECLTTLTKVIDNIIAHPAEEKYRKIKRANAGFSRKVGGVPGGEACMRALGFAEHGDTKESWLLAPSAEAWNVLNAGRVQIQTALASLPASGAPAAASAGAGTAGFAGGLGVLPPPGAFPQAGVGGGGMGGMGGGMPDLATMARMAQNPAVMQGMMNDPGVQAMMRSNPQMAAAMQSVMASPGGLAQAFEMIQNNPAMAQMAQQMMQDPTALQRASQMDLGGAFAAGLNATGANPAQGFQPPSGGLGGLGGVPAAAPPGAPTAPPPAPSPSPAPAAPAATTAGGGSGGEGDQEEKTEDELIAEAIRRSMED
eukprot:g6965.t1